MCTHRLSRSQLSVQPLNSNCTFSVQKKKKVSSKAVTRILGTLGTVSREVLAGWAGEVTCLFEVCLNSHLTRHKSPAPRPTAPNSVMRAPLTTDSESSSWKNSTNPSCQVKGKGGVKKNTWSAFLHATPWVQARVKAVSKYRKSFCCIRVQSFNTV